MNLRELAMKKNGNILFAAEIATSIANNKYSLSYYRFNQMSRYIRTLRSLAKTNANNGVLFAKNNKVDIVKYYFDIDNRMFLAEFLTIGGISDYWDGTLSQLLLYVNNLSISKIRKHEHVITLSFMCSMLGVKK